MTGRSGMCRRIWWGDTNGVRQGRHTAIFLNESILSLYGCPMAETSDIIASLRTELPGLREQWPIRSLALFGSRVRDDAKPDSDLDVLVEFDRPVALSSFLALEERLATLTGLRVDLVSAAALKPYIGERVRAEAVAL